MTIINIRHNNSGLYNCFGEATIIHEFIGTDMATVATAMLKVLGKFSIVMIHSLYLNYFSTPHE